MENQITTNSEALKLFFSEDVFLVNDHVEGNLENSPSIAQEAPLQVDQKNITFKYLGKNEKSVFILVNDADNEVSSEQGRALLRNIVKAIGLTAADFALVNYASYSGVSMEEFYSFFNPKNILVFGINPAELKLDLTWHGEVLDHRGANLIFAPNLHLLDQDKAGKVALWGNLKKT